MVFIDADWNTNNSSFNNVNSQFPTFNGLYQEKIESDLFVFLASFSVSQMNVGPKKKIILSYLYI